jgi:hypothetical protein
MKAKISPDSDCSSPPRSIRSGEQSKLIFMARRKIDCGMEVVQHLFSVLPMEEDWCTREERGFTWWGERLAQRIWAGPAEQVDGATVWKVHAQTDFLRNFVDTDEDLGLLTQVASHASLGGGLVRDELHPDRIRFSSCLYVREPVLEWAKGFFPTTAAFQTAEAHLMVNMFAPLVRSVPAFSEHPLRGPAKRHRALDVLGMVVRGGKTPPVWSAEEFMETAEEIGGDEPYPVSATSSGLTIAFPFGSTKAVCEMTTKVAHPVYGNGLVVRLNLPVALPETEAPEMILRCNNMELRALTSIGHFTGSYNVGEQGFNYSNFIPNLESFRGVPFLASMLRLMGTRARWFAEAIGDDWVDGKTPRTWIN